jgi:hypothetical protein
MKHTQQHPAWWQLYLTFPLLIGLFAVEHALNLSAFGHQVAQIVVILSVFGVVRAWVNANARALNNLDDMEDHGAIRVLRMPIARPSALQLPNSSHTGRLDNTFDMDIINAEAMPIEQAAQQ